ncbi:MAG: RNA methyltransferase [Defluviitaleaceae bacterium]|nr:RNA methyltransferase [Defluviitaleaceae bacterium]
MEIITSVENKIVKQAKSLGMKKFRDKHGLFIIEGIKFIEEIPKDWQIERLLISESCADIGGIAKPESTAVISDRIFQSISDTVNPQGVMAVIKQKQFDINSIIKQKNPLIIMLDSINDPGNLGTILRTAQSANAAGIIMSGDCADIYSPKTIRSAAGFAFHIPFVSVDLPLAIQKLKAEGIAVFAAAPNAAKSLYDMDLKKPLAFVIGNESHGISREVADLADSNIKIPIIGQAESLNASMACGIMIYEALRQRHFLFR